jgi:flagellar basal body-associated protein FliL
MIKAALSLLVLPPPQAAERIDFDLQPGVVLFAILFFVLVNLLLAAVLYPYLSGSSEQQQAQAEASPQEDLVEEASSDDEPLEDRVDDFLEDIEQE